MQAKWKRLLIICTLGAFVGIFIVPLNPVNSKFLKLALLACACGAWAGALVLTWRKKPLRIALLILPGLLAVPLLLPGGEIDQVELREDYLQRLTEFEGTEYHWGGESSRGIDCSGLPRRAYRDALLSYGLRKANGRALRSYVEQWWFDASAEALGEGYRQYTSPVGVGGTIREMDYAELVPGDLAITDSGIHALAYAGDGKWIQADPGIGAVATLDGRTQENPWFRVPVTAHRWQLLTSP